MNEPRAGDRAERRIIVGVDFSVPARRALAEARRWGLRNGSRVVPVHVAPSHRRAEWVPAEEEAGWMESEALTVASLVIRWGTPAVELVREARDSGAELLVVGTHGLNGFHPVDLGSTAARVGVLSPVPVILVGDRAVLSSPNGDGAFGSPKPTWRNGDVR